MIKFKALKYKHVTQAQNLYEAIQAGKMKQEAIFLYALGLVAEWDFVDIETNQPLKPEDGLAELSVAQIEELSASFDRQFAVETEIPNANGSPSSYISTPLETGESQNQIHHYG